MKLFGTLALGLLIASIDAVARAEESDGGGRFVSIGVSGGAASLWGKASEHEQESTSDAAWNSIFRTRRTGTGPTLEFIIESRSRRNALGLMLALAWLRGTTTIVSGDPRGEVTNRHSTAIFAATGDWRFTEASPFHGGIALGTGALNDRGSPAKGGSLLFTGSLWLGADWALGGTNIVVGPRVRLDGGVGDGVLASGSLLLDARYWFR